LHSSFHTRSQTKCAFSQGSFHTQSRTIQYSQGRFVNRRFHTH
jgi:hypothetical protein